MASTLKLKLLAVTNAGFGLFGLSLFALGLASLTFAPWVFAEKTSAQAPEQEKEIRRRPDGKNRRNFGRNQSPVSADDPNRASGLLPVAKPPSHAHGKTITVDDRWRVGDQLGVTNNDWLNPYGPNTLKGDRPWFRTGDAGPDHWWFGHISATLGASFDARQNVRSGAAANVENQRLTRFQLANDWHLYQGNTTFRPPSWAFRLATHTFLDADTAAAATPPNRGDSAIHTGLQQASVTRLLRVNSVRYDYDSLRLGVQSYNHGFRGLIYADNALGLRFFGNRDNNQKQYNLAWFRRFEQDQLSTLNDWRLRREDIFAANLYWQDHWRPGLTSLFSVLWNRYRDQPLGGQARRNYDAIYLGYSLDGSMGRWNVTGVSTLLLGRDRSIEAGNPRKTITAGLLAAELSTDWQWHRFRFSSLLASGDGDPQDHEANGFDAVNQRPLIFAGHNSLWLRQSAALSVANLGRQQLTQRGGLLVNLRGQDLNSPANFSNPGLVMLGVGSDHRLSTKTTLSTQLSRMHFARTAVLRQLSNRARVSSAIGTEFTTWLVWRPQLSQNIVLRASGSWLWADSGYRSLVVNRQPWALLASMTFRY